MNSRTIYLRADFWKELRKDTSIEGKMLLMEVYEAISASTLHSDIEDELWSSDEYLKIIMKKWEGGRMQIELYETLPVDRPTYNAVSLSAIYLAEENNMTCDGIGAKYGVVVLNSGTLKRRQLCKGDSIMLNKGEVYHERYYTFKDKLTHPCNAMLVIDPYLLSRRENIENNVASLLDVMLPTNRQEYEFHISFFSTLGMQSEWQMQTIYDELQRLIIRLRKCLTYSLTLYSIGKGEAFHSRMIITNNAIISAEDGFEVFNGNGKSNKNAKFDIVFPRLANDSRQDMSNYLRWIKIAKEYSEECSTKIFFGSRTNRLYSIVD